VTRCLLLVLVLMLSLPLQAVPRLSLSPPPYQQAQSLQLTVTADGLLAAEALDIKPLFASFIIGQLRWQQDSRQQITQWHIPLVPRLSGRIPLPALRVGEESTAEQPLQIAPPSAPAAPDLARQAAQLQGQLSREQALVGQPLIYEARIWMHPGVQMASLTAPSLEGASISVLGEDEQTSELHQGQRVLGLLRRYLVVPEVPGALQLYGVQAQGEELEDAQGLQMRARPLRLQAPNSPLVVAALPPDAPELVAEAVRLTQRWEPTQGPYRLGAPIIRELTLELVNADPRRLPALSLPQHPGLRSYEDGNQLQIRLQDGRLQIRQTLRQALIPISGAVIALPAIEIPWWDAVRQEVTTARLPAIDLPLAAPPAAPAVASPRQSSAPWRDWWLGLVGLPLLLWLLICQHRRQRRQPISLPLPPTLALIWHSLRLIRAGQQADARQLHACLLTWARWRWPVSPPSCVEAMPCYRTLASELDPLLAACFAPDSVAYRWPAGLTRRLLTWRQPHEPAASGHNPGALD